ncbi:hypothetical protein BH09ACT4_BH09ACT4_24240 [soil metagenome]
MKDYTRTFNLWLKVFTPDLKGDTMNDVDSVGGYSVPVDPMDDLQCESCQ